LNQCDVRFRTETSIVVLRSNWMPLEEQGKRQQVQEELTQLRSLGAKRRSASIKLLLAHSGTARAPEGERQRPHTASSRRVSVPGGNNVPRGSGYILLLVVAAAVAIIAGINSHAHKPVSLAVLEDR
jgi:hypothetical protein